MVEGTGETQGASAPVVDVGETDLEEGDRFSGFATVPCTNGDSDEEDDADSSAVRGADVP